MYKLEFDKRAVSELTDIVSWYATKSPSAAEKFETAFKWDLETLVGGIIDYIPFTKEIKRAPDPDFPYSVYYSRREETTTIFIHAILHTKRKPEFIFKRLNK